MKGSELIKLIQDNNLEDLTIYVSYIDGYNVFPNVKSVRVKGLADIGHSDQVAILEGQLKSEEEN